MYENIYEPSYDAIKTQLTSTKGKGYESFTKGFRDFDFNIADEIMAKGAIDLHIHARPCAYIKRQWSMAEVAIKACEKGMKAVVFKNHAAPSVACFEFIQEIVDRWAEEHEKNKIDLFGGTVLNYPVGGINKYAVDACVRFGGKFVWLPGIHSSHQARLLGRMIGDEPGIDVLDSNDKVLPELKEIFDIIAENNMILVCGHQSVKERLIIIDEAKKHGVKKILVDHPSWWVNKATIQQQAEMAKKGAYIGMYWCAVYPSAANFIDSGESLNVIREVPVDQIVGGTDFAAFEAINPVEALRQFILFLLLQKVEREVIEKIFVHNPKKLIYG